MAFFLDNTGDIVLDAVLTDYGRQLLARGDGSFKITKFALGDDEVDYSLYDSAEVSALKDQKILQTPILEAMTNNAASMKSKLLTITTKNLLFLPILQLNQVADLNKVGTFFTNPYSGYVVPANDTTYNALTASVAANDFGILDIKAKNSIRIDQGLNSVETLNTVLLSDVSPDLYETEYNITIDNRFGKIVDIAYAAAQGKPTIDDDQMALWKFTTDANSTFVKNMVAAPGSSGTTDAEGTDIRGTRGSKLLFSIAPQLTLINGNYFDKYGLSYSDSDANYKVIKTVVKVTGVTTGYSLDIPVAFAKKV